MDKPRPRRYLWLGMLLMLGTAGLVAGQDQTGRYDVLTGTHKESSCALRDAIHAHCNATVPAPALNTTPVPSPCTCNKIYFNIWSACSYASGNNTLPVFGHWTTTCTDSAIDLAASAVLTTNTGLGITPPAWSLLDVPGNTSFDLQRAVSEATRTAPKWTMLQILAPVISAIVAILLSFTIILICKRRPARDFRVCKKAKSFFRQVHYVKTFAEPAPTGWVIDHNEEPVQVARPHMPDPLSAVETTHRGTAMTILGNSLFSAGNEAQNGVQERERPKDPQEHDRPPGGRVYPMGIPPSSVPSQAPSGPSSRPSTVSVVDWVKGMHLRMPWKSGPVPVKVTPAHPGFMVDSNGRRKLKPTAQTSMDSITTWGPERPRPSFDERYLDDGNAIELNEQADDVGSERTNLISDDERRSERIMHIRDPRRRETLSSRTRSILGSSSMGHESSLHSTIKIESPTDTTSSASYRNRDSNSRSLFSFIRRPIPPLPPVPNAPMPIPPPPQPIPKLRGSPIGHPLPTIPQGRTMPSIREDHYFDPYDQRRSPSPIRPTPGLRPEQVKSTPAPAVVARRPSGDAPRPLPSPGPIAGPSGARLEILPAHRRSASQPGSLTSSHDGASPAHHAHHAPSRSASSDSNISAGPAQLQRGGSRPLPTPTSATGTSRPAHLPTGAALYHPLPDRSGSLSTLSLNSSSPPAGAVQGGYFNVHALNADDTDDASFYMDMVEPHQRVYSPEPTEDIGLGDPSLLFPASVRGAGYRGTPG